MSLRRARGVGRGACVAVASAALALLAGCVPAAATAEGRDIEALYRVFLGLGAVVAGIVYLIATFAVLRYRRRAGDDDGTLPKQVRGNTRLEAVWTALPLLTVGGLFVGTLLVLGRTEARAAAPAAEIRVEAFRWGWTFSYPAAGVEVAGVGTQGPEVVVPVGRPVRFVLTSPDVVHSFYVPRFLFKRDVIPGRENTFDITVAEPGSYGGQCAEYCGVGHAYMPFTVRAVPLAEYEAWLAQQVAAP